MHPNELCLQCAQIVSTLGICRACRLGSYASKIQDALGHSGAIKEWQARWLAGWLAGVAEVFAWFAGWLGGRVVGWLGGLVAAWLAG